MVLAIYVCLGAINVCNSAQSRNEVCRILKELSELEKEAQTLWERASGEPGQMGDRSHMDEHDQPDTGDDTETQYYEAASCMLGDLNTLRKLQNTCDEGTRKIVSGVLERAEIGSPAFLSVLLEATDAIRAVQAEDADAA
jgi:hypothetical protein